jgi:uncharacterized surface protein with fasciclin (FAS1) repeats
MVLELLLAAGFDSDFEFAGQLTFFAPTNEALSVLTEEEFNTLLNDPARLNELLGYHLVEGTVLAAEFVPGEIVTVNGQSVTVEGAGETLTIAGAPIVLPDLLATNGVVHGMGKLFTLPA